jgi:phosphomannomutase
MFENRTMFGTVEESAHFYEAFMHGGRRYCTENTLYIALLAAREWRDNPRRFDMLFELQARTAREREWGYKFPDDEQRMGALNAVQAHFEARGAKALSRMPNGYDLEATMLRRGLPFSIEADTRTADDWLQVCQRVSQSEDGLARWEVVAAETGIAAEAKRDITAIVQRFGAGEEYQG